MRDLIPTVRAVVGTHDQNECHSDPVDSVSKQTRERWAEFVRRRDQSQAIEAEERLNPVDAF